MKITNRYLVFTLLLLCSSVARAGDVILVNRCEGESLTFVHMRGSKVELKKYELKAGESLVIRGVKFKEKETIWAKGDSWNRFRGTKLHYRALGMEKEADYIVFVDNSRRSMVYGGKLVHDTCIVEDKKDKLINRIKAICDDIVPRVNMFMGLNDELLRKEVPFTHKELLNLKRCKSTIKNLGVFAQKYKDLDKSIDMLIERLEGFEKKGKMQKQVVSIDKKKDKELIAPRIPECSFFDLSFNFIFAIATSFLSTEISYLSK